MSTLTTLTSWSSTAREKDLALAVHDILLQVEGDALRAAEIAHRLGDAVANLESQTKEMINGRAAGEYDRGELGDVDLLLAKVVGADSLNVNERAKDELHTGLLGHTGKGGEAQVGLGLRNQYSFYSHRQCSIYV